MTRAVCVQSHAHLFIEGVEDTRKAKVKNSFDFIRLIQSLGLGVHYFPSERFDIRPRKSRDCSIVEIPSALPRDTNAGASKHYNIEGNRININ